MGQRQGCHFNIIGPARSKRCSQPHYRILWAWVGFINRYGPACDRQYGHRTWRNFKPISVRLQTYAFLLQNGRANDYMPLDTPERASFDYHDEIDLSKIEPMIALPSSPDNVVPVREVAGTPIHQAYIGSSANPAWRDFAVSARMLKGKNVAPQVSFDINPSTRRVLTNLIATGDLNTLLIAGGRLHQTGCNGCNVWDRHQLQEKILCGPSHAIFQVVVALLMTVFIYAALRQHSICNQRENY